MRSRIESIDAMRTICMFIIVLMHCCPFVCKVLPEEVWQPFDLWFNVWWRFAVPFFFATAGYFLAVKLEPMVADSFERLSALEAPKVQSGGANTSDKSSAENGVSGRREADGVSVAGKASVSTSTDGVVGKSRSGSSAGQALFRYVFRAVCVWAVWNLFYVLPSPGLYAELGGVRSIEVMLQKHYHGVYRLIWEGFRGHLWFLMSLAVSALILGVGIVYRRVHLSTAASVILFLIALLGGPYANSPLGFHAEWNLRDGPFIGAFMMHCGYWLYRYRAVTGDAAKVAGGVLAVFAAYAFEVWLFTTLGGVPLRGYDYMLTTPLLGVALLAGALAVPHLFSGSIIAGLGKYSLGIYASHFYFLLLIVRWPGSVPVEVMLGLPVIVYASALLLTLAMSRIPVVKRLVM